MIRVGEKVCCELVGVPYRAFFEIAFDRMPVDISPILFYDISSKLQTSILSPNVSSAAFQGRRGWSRVESLV